MHKLFSRLCCQPDPKRKHSIKVASSPSVKIPSISPPAPPPSRAHGNLESEQTIPKKSSVPESAAEISQRIRLAGHTPGPLELPQKHHLLKTRTSLPDVNEQSPGFQPLGVPTSKSWSNQLDDIDFYPSTGPKKLVISDQHFSPGGKERFMTEPSQRRYSEDVADRNIELYGGIETTAPDERDRFTRRISLPPYKDAHKERSKSLDSNDPSSNEYESRVLLAPDLGQEPARHVNQPFQSVREESDESFNTFLRTTGPVVPPSKDGQKDKNVFRSHVTEPDSDEEQQLSQRKVSVTPSVGFSRYSTAKASLPEDGDDNDAAEADRVVTWRGFHT